MDDTQKNTIKAVGHKAAENIADTATAKAKTATGWKKWGWLALAAAAGAVAWFTLPGCKPLSPEQRARIESVHGLYHDLTGKDCIFVIESK